MMNVMASMKLSLDGVIRESDNPGDVKDTAEKALARAAATAAAFKAMFGMASRKPTATPQTDMQQSAEGRARTEAAAGLTPQPQPAREPPRPSVPRATMKETAPEKRKVAQDAPRPKAQPERAAARPDTTSRPAGPLSGKTDRPVHRDTIQGPDTGRTRSTANTETNPSTREKPVAAPTRTRADREQTSLFGPTPSREEKDSDRARAPAKEAPDLKITKTPEKASSDTEAPVQGDDAEAEAKVRKKRRRALLAKQTRNCGGFEI